MLNFCTILDWCVLVQEVLRLIGIRVAEFDTKVGTVVVHCEAESEFDVVPVKYYASIQIACLIIGVVVLLLVYIEEIMGMSLKHLFDTKAVYN